MLRIIQISPTKVNENDIMRKGKESGREVESEKEGEGSSTGNREGGD